MSEGFAFIDIVFFAMVAAFIAFRLRSVLGRRTGHERRRTGGFGQPSPSASDNIVTLPERVRPAPQVDQAIAELAEGNIKDGLTQIGRADPSFDLRRFLDGAKMAFEMIVDAYAGGDKAALRPLLADDVFAGFASAIDQRAADARSLDTQLIAVRDASVVEAALNRGIARITVRFESEQVNVVRDRDGQVVEGDPATAEDVVDLWTFERDTASSDPNWTLVATRTPG
jgi:predicted lipid-binding transport protein (Tim44 family)